MSTYFLTPITTILQYFSDSGIVLNGGKIYTYAAGTSTPQQTKTDSTGAVNNANPIILNAAGRLNNVNIWQLQGIKLKIIIQDANGNQIGPAMDQISGINDPTDILASLSAPASGSGADLVANAMRSYDLFSSLRAANTPSLAAGQTLVVDVQAALSPGDGQGGLFYWDAASVLTDDGISVIKPTAVSGAGRYLRQKNTSNYANKNALTSRASTTTLTRDPDLSVVLTGLGVYTFEALLLFYGLTTGAGGISIALRTGAASVTNNYKMLAVGNVNGATASSTLNWQSAASPTGQFTAATITAAGSGNDAVYISGVISGGTSGQYSIYWAQNSSNVNAAVMLPGSWLRCNLSSF